MVAQLHGQFSFETLTASISPFQTLTTSISPIVLAVQELSTFVGWIRLKLPFGARHLGALLTHSWDLEELQCCDAAVYLC